MNIPTPDYTHWSRLELWSIKHAARLFCGIEPWHYEFDYREYPAETEEAIHKISSLIETAVNANVLENIPISNRQTMDPAVHLRPQDVVGWAQKKGISIPQELSKAFKVKQPNDLGAREKDTLLKLICGMACAGYGYDPKALRSLITKEIYDDLLKLGISINEDTIKKWLTAACKWVEENKDEYKP
jgi:hypothetical protein